MDELKHGGSAPAVSTPQGAEAPVAAPTPAATETAAGPEPRPYGRVALMLALLLTAVLFVATLAPIAAPVLLGALLAGFAIPWRNRLSRHLHHRTMVATVLTVGAILLVIVPLGLLALVIADRLQAVVTGGALARLVGPNGAWHDLVVRYPLLARVAPGKLGDEVTGGLKAVAGSLPQVLSSVLDGIIGVFLTLITLFYLIKDGHTLLLRIERALPLEPRHTRAIFKEFERVGQAFIIGTLGTAALQGVLAGAAYWVLGVPEALLLGVLTGVIAVVPIGGSTIVWIPVGIFLVVTGHATKGFILLAWGAVVIVGMVDNFVRPLLTRGGLDLHPLLVFLAIFGGLAAFGGSGLYLGPLFVALFMSVAHIYEREIAPSTAASPVNQDAETASLWRAVQALRRGRRP